MRYKQELKQNIILLLLFLISIGTQAQYSGYPGGSWINLPAPQPPRGTTYAEIWSTQYTEQLTVSNSLVKILKYYEGKAYVQCEYYYAYSVGNYEQHAKGIAYYDISCNPVSISGIPTGTVTMKVGETKDIYWSYSPNNVDKPTLRWRSTYEDVAWIEENYMHVVLHAKSAGTTNINIINESGLPSSFNVVVEGSPNVVYVNSISLNETSLSLTEGSTKQLQATVLPSNATDKSVSWSSSNNSVAQVNSSGLVTTKSTGTAIITCTANDGSGKSATCSVTVKSSTVTNATCAEILAGEDDKTYRVTGTVKSIVNTTYGNWYLEDSTGEIYIYGTRDRNGNTGKNNSIEDWGIKEGYLVTVEGPRKTYKGTVELVDVVVVDCHEKSGDGTLERPLNAASANAIGLALGEGNTSEESYYIKGKVSRIKEEFTTTYGNCTFYISDDGTQNNEFYIYRALYLGNKKFTSNDQKLKEGDDVIIYGKITNYKGTPETKDKEAYLYSLNGLTGSGNGTLENPFNAFEALNEARKLSIGETSSNSFFVKGIISEIKTPYSEKYHRAVFYISDDGTANNQFLAYGTYYLENKQWIEGYSQIAVGDNVILYGKMCNYNGIYEMADKQNYIYSHNGNTKVQYIPNTMDVITSNTGNATFYDSHSAYSLPSGLNAQVITNASNSKLTYKTIADGSVRGVVPRGTAVMLVSDTKQAGTFTLKSSESTATYTGTNMLRGSDEATTTTGDGYHYKLSYGSSGTNWKNVFGWYWGANDGAPFQIEGHKAWLVVPRGSGTRAAGFSIDGEALGIKTVDDLTISPSDDCYDLQGRRVCQPARKGLYIRRGKKVVVRE